MRGTAYVYVYRERPNDKRIYCRVPGSRLGPEMNAGRNAVPMQKRCGACSVSDPDFGKV